MFICRIKLSARGDPKCISWFVILLLLQYAEPFQQVQKASGILRAPSPCDLVVVCDERLPGAVVFRVALVQYRLLQFLPAVNDNESTNVKIFVNVLATPVNGYRLAYDTVEQLFRKVVKLTAASMQT